MNQTLSRDAVLAALSEMESRRRRAGHRRGHRRPGRDRPLDRHQGPRGPGRRRPGRANPRRPRRRTGPPRHLDPRIGRKQRRHHEPDTPIADSAPPARQPGRVRPAKAAGQAGHRGGPGGGQSARAGRAGRPGAGMDGRPPRRAQPDRGSQRARGAQQRSGRQRPGPPRRGRPPDADQRQPPPVPGGQEIARPPVRNIFLPRPATTPAAACNSGPSRARTAVSPPGRQVPSGLMDSAGAVHQRRGSAGLMGSLLGM